MLNKPINLNRKANYLLVFNSKEKMETETLKNISLLESIDYFTSRPDYIYLINGDNTIGNLIWCDAHIVEMVE
ncbi:hypothetical protein M4L90_12225 [Staphylococcus equorum]|uniref:Uncharacterized protein n=1 Tax=Staphylococcus equorum TaxID=246432 RepID=A0A9X4L581_9STAP|nr:hypothetical protein [Staphylococcus equorum]MDG0820686.1 hypothetical protein [Staphylococcus equorum]MDG0841311.1 hypothetical protein [Staphylococcus equorum]MDG0847011.1 hypothetical protein [Staphylococcus equorum]PTE82287.1 hypothetical protein BUY85_00690 [Staphylococcus equorum]